MSRLEAKQVLAMHFHRNSDGEWYAIANLADKGAGKNGQRLLNARISQEKIEAILRSIHGS